MRKCALRSLSLSYPKKDRWGAACRSFLGYDTDYKILFCSLHRLNSVVDVIPKEGLAGPQPTNPSLGTTTTKFLRHIFWWHYSFSLDGRVFYIWLCVYPVLAWLSLYGLWSMRCGDIGLCQSACLPAWLSLPPLYGLHCEAACVSWENRL